MYVLDYYKQLREDSIKVQNQVFERYNDNYMVPTLQTFRLVKKNKVELESEDEEHSLKEFSIYSHRFYGKTAMQFYSENPPPEVTPRMMEFVEVALQSHIDIFEVEHVDKKDGTIQLLTTTGAEKGRPFCLVDWGLSQTMKLNMLIYTRFIPFPESFQERDYYGDIGMTSGVSYIFHGKDRSKIMKEGNRLARRFKIADKEIRKQVVYFHVQRKFGIQKELI